jgi:hypothetical protein
MSWPDVEGINCFVYGLYVGLHPESGSEGVEGFGLLPLVYTKE